MYLVFPVLAVLAAVVVFAAVAPAVDIVVALDTGAIDDHSTVEELSKWTLKLQCLDLAGKV